MPKKQINKAFSLVELLIYSALLSLVTLFLIQIIIYYQKSSKTIDQISVFQMKINSTITILDYDFNNARYTALQDGVVLRSLYYVDQNGQVVNNNVATDVRKIKLTNNQFRDSIEFYYFDIQENNLAYIGSAEALGGGNSAEIRVYSVNMRDPSFQAMWPDPNVNSNNPNNNGTQPYYVIAYAPDSNGNWVGVLFYITNVQYSANHMQHRPLTFYGGTWNKDIISRYLPSNIIRIIKPKEIYKLKYFVDNNNNLIREVYNFRTDSNAISSTVLLTNVESFNIEVALDRNNDNQVNLNNNGEPVWESSIPSAFEDKVAMLRYTIVLKSNIRNLIGWIEIL